jgi:hypothetical protein
MNLCTKLYRRETANMELAQRNLKSKLRFEKLKLESDPASAHFPGARNPFSSAGLEKYLETRAA